VSTPRKFADLVAAAAAQLQSEHDNRMDLDGPGMFGFACEAASRLLRGLQAGLPVDKIPVNETWQDRYSPVSLDSVAEYADDLEHHALETLDESDGATLWAVLYALAEIREAVRVARLPKPWCQYCLTEIAGSVDEHTCVVAAQAVAP
jgi:hypothetical protein